MKPYAAIIGWLAVGLASLALTIPARVATDLQAFLPAAATPEQELIVEEIRSGAASGLIMIVAGGEQRAATPGDVERLREALDATGHFRLVASRPDPALLTARDRLFRYRYLLSDRVDAAAFTPEALRPHFAELAARLAEGDPMLDERIAAADPTGEFRHLLGRWLGATASSEHATSGWRLGDGRAVLLALTDAAPYELDAQSAALDAIERRARTLDPALPVALAGAPAVATASRDIIRDEAIRVSALASIGTLLVLLLALRSLRAAGLALVPVLTGLLTGAAAVRLGFGELHGITLAFGVTLLGVTIDYPLHHFWHRAGHEAGTPIRRRLFVSAASTALGFAAMAVAGYPGLQQLALLSATGIVTAAATTAWVLPVLAPAPGRAAARVPHGGPGVRVPRWVPLATAGALMLGGLGASLGGLSLQTDLGAMSPVPTELAERDRELRARLGFAESRYVVQLAERAREAVLRETEALADELAARPERVDRFQAVTRLMPSDRTQRARAAALPAPDGLRTALRAALADLPLRVDAFEPFVEAVGASRELAPLTPEDLPPGLVRQRIDERLEQRGERWFSTVHLGGIGDPEALSDALAESGGWRLIDLQAEASALLTSYQRQALQHFGLGGVGIALVLLAGTRSLRQSLAVVAIAGGGVGGTLVLLTALGAAVSVFHVIALLLVVGLGIDYGLFARPGDRTGRGSVSICAASTVLAFSILATAGIPLLRAIGVTVACGTLLAWGLAMLFARGERASADVPASVPDS